jgi:hypothetical protein
VVGWRERGFCLQRFSTALGDEIRELTVNIYGISLVNVEVEASRWGRYGIHRFEGLHAWSAPIDFAVGDDVLRLVLTASAGNWTYK